MQCIFVVGSGLHLKTYPHQLSEIQRVASARPTHIISSTMLYKRSHIQLPVLADGSFLKSKK